MWNLPADTNCSEVDVMSGARYVCTEAGILRQEVNGTSRLVIPKAGVRSMALLSGRRRLLLSDGYGVEEYSITGSFVGRQLSCSGAPARCDSIVALAADQASPAWLWLSRSSNGSLTLTRASPRGRTQTLGRRELPLPRLRAMRALGSNNLLLLTHKGRLAILPTSLAGNASFFPANEAYVGMSSYVAPEDHLISAGSVSNIRLDSDSGLVLRWDARPRDALFNVSISSASDGTNQQRLLVQGPEARNLSTSLSGRNLTVEVSILTPRFSGQPAKAQLRSPFIGIADKRFYFTYVRLPENSMYSVNVALGWKPNPAWQLVPFAYRLTCNYGRTGLPLGPQNHLEPIVKRFGIQHNEELLRLGNVPKDSQVTCRIAALRTQDDTLPFEEVFTDIANRPPPHILYQSRSTSQPL